MRKVTGIAVLFLGAGLWTASAAASGQSPRQALMEMFFSKEPGTLIKHLPATTRASLEQSGALAKMQQYSVLASQFHSQGSDFQTFDSGPVLISTTDPKTGQKTEVIIENDSQQGDHDDIQLGFKIYKEGQVQRTPFMPRVTFSMKMESGTWTLADIAFSFHIPLADPDFLKAMTDGVKAHTTPTITTQVSMEPSPTSQPSGFTRAHPADSTSLAAVHSIVAAEKAYAATYPTVGYTCTLSDLDGFGAAQANEHQAMLINSGLAGGHYHGYTFSLSGCQSTPATSFQLTATPIGESFGRRTFCADQSGAVRASTDGNAAACQATGAPVE